MSLASLPCEILTDLFSRATCVLRGRAVCRRMRCLLAEVPLSIKFDGALAESNNNNVHEDDVVRLLQTSTVRALDIDDGWSAYAPAVAMVRRGYSLALEAGTMANLCALHVDASWNGSRLFAPTVSRTLFASAATLQTLRLHGIFSDTAPALSAAVAACSQLTELSVSGDAAHAVPCAQSVLEKCPRLHTLRVGKCGMDDEDVARLAAALASRADPIALDVTSNYYVTTWVPLLGVLDQLSSLALDVVAGAPGTAEMLLGLLASGAGARLQTLRVGYVHPTPSDDGDWSNVHAQCELRNINFCLEYLFSP
jgi:hypothetical protein